MNLALASLLAVFACIAASEEPKRLTAEEVEKKLSIAEASLKQDRDKTPADAKLVGKIIAHDAAANVVRSVGALPEGSPVRLRAIALARKYASIPEYAIEANRRKQKRPEGIDDRLAHARLHFAWGVLRQTGVLRDGMRLEEYVGLLGQPTKVGPKTVEWYYSSGMHVNPCLRLWKEGGREKKGRIEETRY